MTATATAHCASNPVVYVKIVARKSSTTPIFRLTTLSSSSSSSSSNISSLESSTAKGRQNSNNNQIDHSDCMTFFRKSTKSTTEQQNQSFKETEIEEILSGVRLRRKITQRVSPPRPSLRPLTKRLAVPVCLLPLNTNLHRIQHALSIVLPYLKFLSIIRDLESFCLTDASIFIESLPPRSATQMRSVFTAMSKTTTTTIKRKTKRHFTSKADFISSAGEYLHQNTTTLPMNKYVRSAINCHVVLDRLDEYTIDQLMKNSNRPLNRNTSLRAISEHAKTKLSLNTRNSLNQTTTKTTTTCTTITTMTTEKTTVKQKSTRTSFNPAKRIKTSNDDCIVLPSPQTRTPSLSFSSCCSSSSSSNNAYQRIYLKCFICSKREYIDAKLTTSDALHLHWLEHGNDLSLNIYDSIIDSILTRVVEFFHFPKKHNLEGKIQTVFILNSEEVRRSRPTPQPSPSFLADDTCIILD